MAQFGLVIAVVCSFLMPVAAARGAVFNVNSTGDAVDASVGNGVCATAGAVCTLRAALQEANASFADDTIQLGAQTYLLTIAGTGDDQAQSGDLDVASAATAGHTTIQGQGASVTILDGGGLDRVLDVHGDARVEGVTIQNGAAVTASNALGGGVHVHGGASLELLDCRVRDNQANLAGGIMNRGALVIERCEITGNEALNLGFTSAFAGGISSASQAAAGSAATMLEIHDSLIADNTAYVTPGGIELSNAGAALLRNVTVSGNTPTQIVVYEEAVTLDQVTVVAPADRALIAGSYDGSETLTIRNSAFSSPVDDACFIGTPGPMLAFGTNAADDSSCGFTVVAANLGLGPLADNGGPTRTHLPLAGSPLIDAGATPDCSAADQRGVPRPQDGDGVAGAACDLGAVEVPEPGAAVLGMTALVTLLCRSILRTRSRVASRWLSRCAGICHKRSIHRGGLQGEPLPFARDFAIRRLSPRRPGGLE
jgi:CSLREA domain-containing protein